MSINESTTTMGLLLERYRKVNRGKDKQKATVGQDVPPQHYARPHIQAMAKKEKNEIKHAVTHNIF